MAAIGEKFRVSIPTLALVFAVAAVVLLSAERSSAQLTLGCTPALSSLVPCIGYLVGNSSAPTSGCCSPLAGVVQTQAQCLCAILSGGITQLGFFVNQTQALKLPGSCNIRFSTLPPAVVCPHAYGSTATVPAPSTTPMPTLAPPPSSPSPVPALPTPPSTIPSNAPPSVPSASAPSGNGLKTTREASTARSSTKFTPTFFFTLLVVAFYTWI